MARQPASEVARKGARRPWVRTLLRAAILASLAVTMGACAQTKLAVHTVKRILPGDDGGGAYKVGAPYQINGIWYTPAEDPFYNETGIASWYGRPFHGQRTANGEIYDMNALTAAHKTLPMPSWVRVTNLENGRSMVLKVNDRGPFVHGRIIDVSMRAAQLLGFSERGTARARVEAVPGPNAPAIVAREPDPPVVAVNALPTRPVADRPAEAADPLAMLADLLPAGVTTSKVADTAMYVQAGAFASYDSANALRMELEPLGNVTISTVSVGGQRFYRVRIGPLDTVPRADTTLAMVMARGHSEARIVVD
ncbi:MAG: septal ring lytic transglycosylase RlpA family protein [Proteobacteria bacterium]|nr:septal ring lytic transglycosylase RlpA family protein [Pseudomonadota bacterium]